MTRVRFLDGPWGGQEREVDLARVKMALQVQEEGAPLVEYDLLVWNGATYGHIAPVRLVGAREATTTQHLAGPYGGVVEAVGYQRLTAQVVAQEPLVDTATLIRWRRDDEHDVVVLGVEGLACP